MLVPLLRPHLTKMWLPLGHVALPTLAKVINWAASPLFNWDSPTQGRSGHKLEGLGCHHHCSPIIKGFFTLNAGGGINEVWSLSGGCLCYSPVSALMLWGGRRGDRLPGHVVPTSDLRQLWVGGRCI